LSWVHVLAALAALGIFVCLIVALFHPEHFE